MNKKRAAIPFDVTFFKKETAKKINRSVGEKFTYIFNSNHWAGKQSNSGNGSDLMQTEEIRKNLPHILNDFHIKVFLDLPCGDHNWMNSAGLHLEKYIGADIVAELIESNRVNYANENKQFLVLNLLEDNLPDADLLFCRDCFVHFSNADIFKAVQNIKRANIQYIFTTTFTGCEKNEDITTGDWRIINLEKPPFNFPPPLLILNENCTEGSGSYRDKSMALWRVKDI